MQLRKLYRRLWKRQFPCRNCNGKHKTGECPENNSDQNTDKTSDDIATIKIPAV